MAKYKIMNLACQVSPFNLKLNQINSEMNSIATVCTDVESQKKALDAEVN